MESAMLSDRVFIRKLSGLALPIAAQSLMLSAVSVADTLMLGGVEQSAMAAVAKPSPCSKTFKSSPFGINAHGI